MNIVLTYLTFFLLLLLETIVFMWHRDLCADGNGILTEKLWLSLPVLLKISAYVMALPLALRLIYTWISGNWHNAFMRVYMNIAGTIAFILWLCNLTLFGYAEYKIDTSIVHQLTDNPGQTLADISFLTGVAILVLLGVMVFCLHWIASRLFPSKKHDPLIFIPIRPSAAVRAMRSVFILLILVGANYLLEGDMPTLPKFEVNFPTKAKNVELPEDTLNLNEADEAWKELYAMPHSLGLDNTDAYQHPRPQMIKEQRPNVIIVILPGFIGANSKILNAEADATLMPFTNKMYENGIGFTRLYANNADGKLTNLNHITKVLKENDYDVEELKGNGEDDKALFNRAYNSIEEGRNEGIGKAGKPFLKVISTNPTHTIADADACLKSFVGRLWYTPTWRNTLIIGVGVTTEPKDAKLLDDAEQYHVTMFWTGGVVSARGHVDIMCQHADIAATLLGQMGINYDNIDFSNNIFDRAVPHFAFFKHDKSYGFLTDSISYIQGNDGKALPGTNDPEGKAKKWGRAASLRL